MQAAGGEKIPIILFNACPCLLEYQPAEQDAPNAATVTCLSLR